jgi:hypothetical protein
MNGTKAEDYLKYIGDAMGGKVKMIPPMPGDARAEPPSKSPYGLVYYELERLEYDGKKVYNSRKGDRRGYDSDDVAQVVVHANRMVQDSVVDIDDGNSKKDRLHREQTGSLDWTGRGAFIKTRRGW